MTAWDKWASTQVTVYVRPWYGNCVPVGNSASQHQFRSSERTLSRWLFLGSVIDRAYIPWSSRNNQNIVTGWFWVYSNESIKVFTISTHYFSDSQGFRHSREWEEKSWRRLATVEVQYEPIFYRVMNVSNSTHAFNWCLLSLREGTVVRVEW